MAFRWVERDGLSPYLAPTEAPGEGEVAPVAPVSALRPVEPRGLHVIPHPEVARAYEKPGEAPPPQPALRVGQIMTAPAVTVPVGSSLEEARAVMRASHVRYLPVLSPAERPVGLLSDRYLLRGEGTAPAGASAVEHLMSTMFLTATPDTGIREAARVMTTEGIGCLPILEKDGRLAGILTTTDILRCIVNRLPLDLWV